MIIGSQKTLLREMIKRDCISFKNKDYAVLYVPQDFNIQGFDQYPEFQNLPFEHETGWFLVSPTAIIKKSSWAEIFEQAKEINFINQKETA